MPKSSEIFDTPEATGFSQVGDNKKPLRICNKTGVHTCRLGSIHLNEREAQILTEYLTTKDQEKEEAIRAERSRIYGRLAQMKSIYETMDTRSALIALMGEDIIKSEALPTEDNK